MYSNKKEQKMFNYFDKKKKQSKKCVKEFTYK